MQVQNFNTEEQPGKEFLLLFSNILFIVNLLAFLNAYEKGGWVQIGLLVIAPIYNGLFMLIGGIIVVKIGKMNPHAS
jgi:hypothetical protein